MRLEKNIKKWSLLLFSVCTLGLFANEETTPSAATTETPSTHAETTSTEHYKAGETHEAAAHQGHEPLSDKFNPTPMIMEHIADAHDFHVVGSLHIPLPVIIYNFDKGLSIFSSSRFVNHETHHATESYQGYRLKNGKIVSEDGSKFIDLSITKVVFTMLLAAILLCVIFFNVAGAYTTRKNKAPKGLQSLIEPLVLFVRDDIAKPGLGHHYERFLPYLMTAFFFIFINNLLGLIPIFPGGANVTGNIAVTLVLALFTGILININGTKDYWKHIFAPPVPLPLYILMIPVEMIGVLTKPITLMVRLFANITAGHIVVLSLVSLIFVFGNYNPAKDVVESPAGAGVGAIVAILFTLFISVIELLVAFIQAFIFTMLSAVFIGMALEEHAEHH